MSADQKKSKKVTSEELESLINKGLKKIGGYKDNQLCRYLPVDVGGYMHHFTFRKLKTEDPGFLAEMIETHILNVDSPSMVAPKPRAARGSRRRRDQVVLTRGDLERMLNIARMAGDKEMVAKLTPKKSLPSIKRDLIASIRQGKVEVDLWNSYVEAIGTQNDEFESAAFQGQTNSVYSMTGEQN